MFRNGRRQNREKRKKKKEKEKNWIPNMPNESQTSSNSISQGMKKEALPGGAPHAGGALGQVATRLRCDSPQSRFMSRGVRRPMESRDRAPKNPVLCLFCRSSPVSPQLVMEKGAMENSKKKVWRVGPICAMEKFGMVGGLSPQFGPSACVYRT
jgi:hypothetical protein